MRHADDRRLTNLVGAVALGLGGQLPATGAAALLTLANFDGEAPLTTLVTALGLTHSGVVRTVDQLVRHGQAERLRGTDDSRTVRVRLTAAGSAEAERLQGAREAAVANWLTPLDDDERRALVAIAEKLLAGQTGGRADALHICRMCDADVCGHPERCPVTLAADRAQGA